MPFINIKTNQSVSRTQQESVKAGLGKAITALPGKSEQWLMVAIEPDAILYYQGTDAPAAMIQVQICGAVSSQASENLTARICELIQAELNIPQNRIYISYFGTPDWGWNGTNF